MTGHVAARSYAVSKDSGISVHNDGCGNNLKINTNQTHTQHPTPEWGWKEPPLVNPSWRQATAASEASKPSPQTVPHTPSTNISNRPDPCPPDVRRVSGGPELLPSLHTSPTSCRCPQVCDSWKAPGQSCSRRSYPMHVTCAAIIGKVTVEYEDG